MGALIEVTIARSFGIWAVFFIALSACAQRHRNPAPDHVIFQEQRPQLLWQLEAAEETDATNARDPQVSLIRKEDFFEQADKAERAIRELLSGYDLSRAELADALTVPPKSFSPEAKADLIRRLQDAIALNDRNEQGRLNDYFSAASFDPAPYDAQKLFAAAVIKELTIGEDVPWDTLREALQVLPQSN